jgi:large subunit ribosomal protein L25
VLNIVSHEVALYCPADFIPEEIMVDLTGLHIGQSVHLAQIKLPANVTAVSRDDITLATISAMGKEEEVPVEAPVAAEVPATAQKAVEAPGAAPAAAGTKDAKAAAAPAKDAKAAAAPAAPTAAKPAEKKK